MTDAVEEARDAFDKIYAENYWGIGSGTGSLPIINLDYIHFLSRFMDKNSINTVLDFGCGDWQFSRYIDWSSKTYLGVDLVANVIAENELAFAKDNVHFEIFRDFDLLPKVDLCIAKDVFQHLPIAMINDAIDHLQEKAKFLLITNDVYPDQWLNVEIPPGAGRAIRLNQTPFDRKGAVVFSYSMITYGNYFEKQTFLILGKE